LQLTPHPAAPHTGAPLASTGHTVPHLPQFEMSASSLTQAAPQLEKPAAQLTPQLPPAQAAEPLVGVGQVTAQSPQFCGSVPTLTQEPPQFFWFVGQLAIQLPPEQTSPEPQARPHAPQLLGSLSVSTHAPLHLAKLALHVMSHAPPRQMAAPFAGASQTWPQPPQLDGSDCVSLHPALHTS
jgi:hypothetical protein